MVGGALNQALGLVFSHTERSASWWGDNTTLEAIKLTPNEVRYMRSD